MSHGTRIEGIGCKSGPGMAFYLLQHLNRIAVGLINYAHVFRVLQQLTVTVTATFRSEQVRIEFWARFILFLSHLTFEQIMIECVATGGNIVAETCRKYDALSWKLMSASEFADVMKL